MVPRETRTFPTSENKGDPRFAVHIILPSPVSSQNNRLYVQAVKSDQGPTNAQAQGPQDDPARHVPVSQQSLKEQPVLGSPQINSRVSRASARAMYVLMQLMEALQYPEKQNSNSVPSPNAAPVRILCYLPRGPEDQVWAQQGLPRQLLRI